MKVKILGHQDAAFTDVVREAGLSIVDENPEVIIAHGGDGTFIGSERLHPGIPKLGVRHGRSCIKCPRHEDRLVLEGLRDGTLDLTELAKIDASCGEESLTAVNDVILRNADPRAAVRFFVSLNDQRITEELIADGVVVCTPFGSSAYFRSITRMVIRTGLGVAFNNCTDLLHHLVVGDDEHLRITLTRGPADVVVDNDPTRWTLEAGDEIAVRRSAEPARILAVDTLRCPDCRYVSAPRRRY